MILDLIGSLLQQLDLIVDIDRFVVISVQVIKWKVTFSKQYDHTLHGKKFLHSAYQ